ncbi:MAG: hypothetical protein HKN63_01280 [Rhodobacteraceae bacterium]|nr:hypothetical protein [Paracoccaceae bacterium]
MRLSILLLTLLLPGCSAISALGQASQPLEIYELQTPAVQQAASRRNIELVVEEPSASGALAIERVMIRPAPFQAQYLPGVRWADTAPVMLQTLMVRSLTETGALGSVGRRPVGTAGDYAILSELTDFQAELADQRGGAVIRVRLILRIVRERDARVVATRTFSVTEGAASTDTDAIVAAFDLATSRLLSDAVSWIIPRVR